MITLTHTDQGTTAWDGKIILSREFYNPDTKDYIHLEAHETNQEGMFVVAEWVPDGNNGGMEGSLREVAKWMQKFVPPEGFREMEIPQEAFC